MRGKKDECHTHPDDPPRRRGNRRRGHGTYASDRPPVWGMVERASGQVRLRVCQRVDSATLHPLVLRFSAAEATLYTDEWNGYNGILRHRVTVHHEHNEWARDDDGDGFCEVHVNTLEGLWASVRTFLRPFRGVHKRFLHAYIAIFEFSTNIKAITQSFIAQLVRIQVPCT